MTASFEIRRIRGLDDPDVVGLVARSDEYLDSLYPPESNFAEPLDVLVGKNSAFFAAYDAGCLVACGAVKLLDGDVRYGEIKRLYVEDDHRGKGFAAAVVRHLEDYARQGGAQLVRLEAGTLQPEAIGLYRKLGYRERGPFGSYPPDPLSVFMEKDLQA